MTGKLMKAMEVRKADKVSMLVAVEIPEPQPQDNEVLIRIRAAGVTPTELGWYPTSHTEAGEPRTGAVPGHEFSGVVAAFGKSVSGFETGQEVYGMNDWFVDGATAEFCLTEPGRIATKPVSLTHTAAATVPIGALTAWQGLLERARIRSGEQVLVHGGAGAVGVFAVRLANLHGAYVIATAASRDIDFVKRLGAGRVIDYQKSRFEDEIAGVDVVFDSVGGETLDRSWSVLKPGGRMITIASGGSGSKDQRVKDAFFIVEPRHEQLAAIALLLDAGKLKTFANTVVPLEKAAMAYSGAARERALPGKVVVAVSS